MARLHRFVPVAASGELVGVRSFDNVGVLVTSAQQVLHTKGVDGAVVHGWVTSGATGPLSLPAVKFGNKGAVISVCNHKHVVFGAPVSGRGDAAENAAATPGVLQLIETSNEKMLTIVAASHFALAVTVSGRIRAYEYEAKSGKPRIAWTADLSLHSSGVRVIDACIVDNGVAASTAVLAVICSAADGSAVQLRTFVVNDLKGPGGASAANADANCRLQAVFSLLDSSADTVSAFAVVVPSAPHHHASPSLLVAVADSTRQLSVYRCSQAFSGALAKDLASDAALLFSHTLAASVLGIAFVTASSLAVLTEDKAERTLTMWDTAFGTVQRSHILPVADTTDSSPNGVNSKSPKLSGTVAGASKPLSLGRRSGVMAVSFNGRIVFVLGDTPSVGLHVLTSSNMASHSTLADALGSMAHTVMAVADDEKMELEAPLLPGPMNAVPFLSDPRSWNPDPSDQSFQHEKAVLALVESATKDGASINAPVFISVFDEAVTALKSVTSSLASLKRRRPAADHDHHDADSHAHGRTPLFSQQFLSKVTGFCLDRKEQDLLQPLETLITSNSLSMHYRPDLLQRLLEQNHLRLVEKCLVHIHDVPESELVRVVQYATDQISSGNPNTEKSGARKVEADDHAAERLLHLVLTAPRSDLQLQQALRSLSGPQLVILLRYLLKWTSRYWSSTEEVVREQNRGTRLPSFAQVLDWTTCLLDAQLSNIVMLPDAHVCLRDLTHLVCGQHLPLCEDIEHLRGVLKHFMHHGAVPLKPVLDYDVEVLFL